MNESFGALSTFPTSQHGRIVKLSVKTSSLSPSVCVLGLTQAREIFFKVSKGLSFLSLARFSSTVSL